MNSQALQAIKAYEKSLSGYDVDYTITDTIALNDSARLCLFEADGIRSSAVAYDDGAVFILDDWQGSRPTAADDIPDYSWLSADGRRAIIIDGLPRSLA